MATLWASPDDRRRLAEAESVVFLIGGYDGSGNYGDVLQVVTAIETATNLPGPPLAVPIVEREMLGHHEELASRYREALGNAAFAFFEDPPLEPGDGLERLTPLTPGRATLIYIYGGGHLNSWWGGRKAAHAAAAEQFAGGRRLPVVASGLQVDKATVAPDGPAHELLARASWIGVRDRESLRHIRELVPGLTERVELAGDDAVPVIERGPVEENPVVNLHVNDGTWVSDKPEAVRRNIVAMIGKVGHAAGEPLVLQPVIAYEDPRVSERQIVSSLLEQRGGELEAAGLRLGEPLDLLEDAMHNDLASFRRARLTVSCSYHVTLTSLLAGIPAVLFAKNGYYAQKAAGLRDLFQLGPLRVGVPGTSDNAPAAVEAMVDGPARAALVSHLRTQSERVFARFEQGRAALSVALAESLKLSALEAELGAERGRADAAEHELAAVRSTRGWKALKGLRAVRDMMR